MKKIWLSIGVILAFGIYAFVQKRSQPSLALSSVNSAPSSQTSGTTNSSSSRRKSVANYNTPSYSGTGNSNLNQQNTNYKDGSYTGDSYDAYYGNVQVQVTIQSGKITTINFPEYPSDRQTSQMINNQALPMLKQEVIQAQSANVNMVSGATMTSRAFIQSLQSALSKAV